MKTEEQKARELLESKGYFVGNLWSVQDVQSRFNCTDEEAQLVLEKALTNEATMEQIWLSISFAAEEYNLEKQDH